MNPQKATQLLAKGSGGIASLMVGGGLLYGLYNSFYTVEGGQRAIIFSRFGGVKRDIYAEGLHLKIPLIQYPAIYDVRSKPRIISSPTGSKDLQMVNISLRVLSRPDTLKIPVIHQEIGPDYDDKVLPSITNEVLKAVVAKFNANQLITQREQVSLLIRKQLIDRARDFNIIIDDVSITELSFSKLYSESVEKKQIAQQEAQRAQFTVMRAEQERQQKIVNAQGESQAALLIGEALNKNAGYLKLRKIKAAEKISKMLSSSQNKAYLNSNTLMLNINDSEFDDAIDRIIKK